jgi:predicted transcriptional regulator
MKGYSHFLLNKGLMRMISENGNGGSRLLEATDKGREFLKAYAGLKALMK